MKNLKIYELPCYDRCKSFYSKAHVLEQFGYKHLKSYETIVCILSDSGEFTKLWDDYSVTTMRHINSFLEHFGYSKYGGKKWWESIPYNESIKLEV